MKIDHKAEALRALDESIETVNAIASGKELAPLEWIKLGAVMGYARANIEKIQELKRIRKPQSQDPVKP